MRVLRLLGAVLLASIALGSASACQVALRAEDEDARCEPSGIGYRLAVEFDPLPMAA